MQLSTTYSRFIQALNVMNAVLEGHRDSPVLKPLLDAADLRLAGCNLVVAILESEDESAPPDYVTIRLQDGLFVLVAHEQQDDEIAWTVSEEYLAEVAAHPRRYIDRPQQLDLEWLKRRAAESTGADVDTEEASLRRQGRRED